MSATFTAAEIATALRKSARAIRFRLANVAPVGNASVRGQLTPSWSIIQLPAILRGELERRAAQIGCRDVPHLLAMPGETWQPKVALPKVAHAYVSKARRLREAFSSTLARLNDLSISEADFRARGLAEYRAVFGHAISEKQWRRLLDRTVTRDGCAEDWQRLEIYLDDNCTPAEQEISVASALAGNKHPDLRQLVASFARPALPTETEKLLLWQVTFERFAELQASGAKPKEARRSLLDFLHTHTPTLAKNRHALHVAFNHKLEQWENGGGKPSALRDRRPDGGNKRRAQDLSDEDRKTLLAYALKFGGGLSQGWREALRAGVLSAELAGRYISNPASKSDVPRAIKRALSNDVKLLADAMHGPRREKLNGPHIERDPNTIAAGDWWQGDDCTLPNLYYEETAQGQRLMRGQFLAMIDVRSRYILAFVLISAPPDRPSTYNAWHIRNLITTGHETYGLPRRGFYFENGSWRAKLLTGDTRDWNESEMGLREFGLRFVHARLPRAKVIESVFKDFQNLCQAEPGYVGRGWHNDRYERVERQQSLVERGHVHASQQFLSREDWVDRLTALVDRYNDEPQEGKYLRGLHGEALSPRQAYEQFFGSEPAVRLPDEARHLLANERFSVKIGRNGIGIDRRRGRGQEFTYKSGMTGELWGRKVEVFFNLESPEIIGVKHPDSGNIFAVRRSTLVPAMDAPAEMLEQAHAENADHASYRRALYRAVMPKFSEHFLARPIFRPTLLDQATVEAGRTFRESAAVEVAAEKEQKRLRRKTAAAAQRIGMPLAGHISEGRAAATEELAALLAEANSTTPEL